MNPVSLLQARKLASELKRGAVNLKKIKLVICPPYVYLNVIKPSHSLSLGAQDVSVDGPAGSFTGEISLEMLGDSSVDWIIVGHSERRAKGETNILINKKIKLALKSGFKTILCVGELERGEEESNFFENKKENAFAYVRRELKEGLSGIDKKNLANLFIAYEPVWALSSNSRGLSAPPEHAFKMALYIRKILLSVVGEKIAKSVPILYGGSVSKENIADFLKDGWLQGALVGSKSLNAKEFLAIAKIASATAYFK